MEGVPPQNLEAEASILSAVLVNNEIMVDIRPVVDASHFYRRSHQLIFQVMSEMADGQRPIDLVTLKDELVSRGVLEEVGGVDALVAIAENVHTSAHAEAHARIVKERWMLRRLQQAAHQILGDIAQQSSGPSEELIDRAEQVIFEISKARRGDNTVAIRDILHEVFAQIEKAQGQGRALIGLPTGYHELDERLNGLQATQLIILAGRPSIGKTTFALNLVENIAVRQNAPVLIFSLEMSRSQIAENLLCIHARVDAHRLRQGRISDEDYVKLGQAAAKVAESQILIDDTPAMTISQLRAKARYEKNRHDIKLIAIDYLQMLDGSRSRQENRQQEVSEIARSLKVMARELNVPVLALSQLSRAPEQREGHKPRLSDLRESGSIEQDADVVMFLNRDDYYDREKKPGVVEVDIAKQRNGPTGVVELAFLRNLMRFENLAAQREPQEAPF